MIKRKSITAMLIASSIIDKKPPRPGRRAEHQLTDSRERTRRKHASRTPEQLRLSSRYFLKRSKIDISRNVKFLSERIPSFRIAYLSFGNCVLFFETRSQFFEVHGDAGACVPWGCSNIAPARKLTAQVLPLRAGASMDHAEIHGR